MGTGGSLEKVKKLVTFAHGSMKNCFCYSTSARPGPPWDMALMPDKARVFMSKTHSSTEKVL